MRSVLGRVTQSAIQTLTHVDPSDTPANALPTTEQFRKGQEQGIASFDWRRGFRGLVLGERIPLVLLRRCAVLSPAETTRGFGRCQAKAPNRRLEAVDLVHFRKMLPLLECLHLLALRRDTIAAS